MAGLREALEERLQFGKWEDQRAEYAAKNIQTCPDYILVDHAGEVHPGAGSRHPGGEGPKGGQASRGGVQCFPLPRLQAELAVARVSARICNDEQAPCCHYQGPDDAE